MRKAIENTGTWPQRPATDVPDGKQATSPKIESPLPLLGSSKNVPDNRPASALPDSPRHGRVKRTTVSNASQRLIICESETRTIAGLAAKWRDIETGGDLFGLWSRDGIPNIMLVTGPGPDATHEATHFAQDLRFFLDLANYLRKKYGLQWLGTWHSHHSLGLDSPSQGDVEQVKSVTKKNNFRKWCEIILTHEPETDTADQTGTSWWSAARPQESFKIKVNAFSYIDPQKGHNVRAEVRVLRGASPFRSTLLSEGMGKRIGISKKDSSFPLERVILAAPESNCVTPLVNRIPDTLLKKISLLPKKAQEKLQLQVEQDMVIITTTLSEGIIVGIGMTNQPPHMITAVSVKNIKTGESKDVTAKVLAHGQVDICQAYKILESIVTENSNAPKANKAVSMNNIRTPGTQLTLTVRRSHLTQHKSIMKEASNHGSKL